MQEILLDAVHRDVIGKQVKALRRQGKLPAIMYGHGFEPTPILLELHESSKILMRISPSALVTLVLDGEKHLALVREKQRDFIRGTLKHIDFQVVSMLEKLRANVTVVITGESLAVKDFNGVLVTGVDEIEVECLPQDLPERIVVDISSLKHIGDGIYVRDLKVAEKVIILQEPDEMVVVVTGQAAEEVTPEMIAAAAAAAEPEVIEKGKKEEEEA